MVEDHGVRDGLDDVIVCVARAKDEAGLLVVEELALDGDAAALVVVGHDDGVEEVDARDDGLVLVDGAGHLGAEGDAGGVEQAEAGGAGTGHLGPDLGPVAAAGGLEVPGGALVVAVDDGAVVVLVVDVDERVHAGGGGGRVVDVLKEELVGEVARAGVPERVALSAALPLVLSAAEHFLPQRRSGKTRNHQAQSSHTQRGHCVKLATTREEATKKYNLEERETGQQKYIFNPP